MDAPLEIKARLPIEELVAKYVMLKKKGRSLVGLCPFHQDKNPSLLVSPDKGIAYCFACQKGGDIFTFYQQIEGCDFITALKDLAERTGVSLPERGAGEIIKKDEKERIRECLEAALDFYKEKAKTAPIARDYIAKRAVSAELEEMFGIGYAPDSFSETYETLLKKGFSRKEILGAGLGVQKDLKEERIYDRFRNRLMFPISDHQGQIIGFGGRTLGNDDAKYVNSSEGVLYHKSQVLFGMHHAKEEIRQKKRVILVEGYFDVLACHRVGITNVVAVSGTALTEQHAGILKRYADVAALCLDQDRAGKDAAERAFKILADSGMHVEAVTITEKDPDEAATANAENLRSALNAGTPYLEYVLKELKTMDLTAAVPRRDALRRVLSLIEALPLATERADAITASASVFGTTETALAEDLQSLSAKPRPRVEEPAPASSAPHEGFSSAEIALGLLLTYPIHRSLITEMIPPEDGFAAAVYRSLKEGNAERSLTQDERERAAVLALFCEFHGFQDWSESVARREIQKNIQAANREMLRAKQRDVSRKLLEARRLGKIAEEAHLNTQYQQILKLAKMAS